MKCSNPECSRGIGLVSHQRGWFGKQRYCSRICRDAFGVEQPKPSSRKRIPGSYFEWLISQPTGNPQPRLMGAMARVRAR
jgi:hypothetical protein